MRNNNKVYATIRRKVLSLGFTELEINNLDFNNIYSLLDRDKGCSHERIEYI